MTGDEAREALDPRLLDICREWLSIESGVALVTPFLHEKVMRLLRAAYDAGYRRAYETHRDDDIEREEREK